MVPAEVVMIVSVELEKILPDAHRALKFELIDNFTLSHVRKHYEQKFDTGYITGWTDPDRGSKININFESGEDAILFVMRYS